MKEHRFLLLIFLFSLFLTGCSHMAEIEVIPPPEISDIEAEYSVLEGEELHFSPTVINNNNATYTWLVNGEKAATTLQFTYTASVPGVYKIIFKAENEGGSAQKEIIVTVVEKGLPPVISNVEDKYDIYSGDDLEINPNVVSDSETTYLWKLNGEEVASTQKFTFQSVHPGEYTLIFKATNPHGEAEKTIIVTVNAKDITASVKTYTIIALEAPAYAGNDIQWEITRAPSELYRLAYPDSKVPLFVAANEGEYLLQVTTGGIKTTGKITVEKREKEPSPFIAKVFDYMPAPGQFVNKLPLYTNGDTHEDMVRKAGEWLVGEDAFMITLGGWGGSVTFGFDHTIVNVAGKRDFRIRGNAFGAALGRPGAPFGGSCEPGIIMVAYDKNKNGKPDDDEWYEIKGSSNFSAENEPWYAFAQESKNDTRVFRDYEMTYHKPTTEQPDNNDAEPDNPNAYISIKNYIKWEDNKNNTGYKVKNVYHSQTYYPGWVNTNKITFKGIRLPENGINEGEFVPGINDGDVYFVLYGFRYGYVDNHPNISNESAIDIDWAIDKDGNPANLPGIDFVKVYNGVNQENGWLGESSTEVERGEDLHRMGISIETINVH